MGALTANKKLLGYAIIVGFAFLTFIFFHQFGNFKYKIGHWNIRHFEEYKTKLTEDDNDEVSEAAGDIAGVA